MKVEKNVVMLAPESCESKQNSLSYDFFKKRCSGAWLGWHHHQNMFSQKNHNLISFVLLGMCEAYILSVLWAHKFRICEARYHLSDLLYPKEWLFRCEDSCVSNHPRNLQEDAQNLLYHTKLGHGSTPSTNGEKMCGDMASTWLWWGHGAIIVVIE